MRGKPLVPFAITAIIGLLLMLSLSFIGLGEKAGRDGVDGEEGEEVIEFEDPVAAGEELVNRSCIGCHGGDLQGVGGNPGINQLEGKYTMEEIAQIVRNPGSFDLNMPPMPHNQVEAEAIAQYLLSVSQ